MTIIQDVGNRVAQQFATLTGSGPFPYNFFLINPSDFKISFNGGKTDIDKIYAFFNNVLSNYYISLGNYQSQIQGLLPTFDTSPTTPQKYYFYEGISILPYVGPPFVKFSMADYIYMWNNRYTAIKSSDGKKFDEIVSTAEYESSYKYLSTAYSNIKAFESNIRILLNNANSVLEGFEAKKINIDRVIDEILNDYRVFSSIVDNLKTNYIINNFLGKDTLILGAPFIRVQKNSDQSGNFFFNYNFSLDSTYRMIFAFNDVAPHHTSTTPLSLDPKTEVNTQLSKLITDSVIDYQARLNVLSVLLESIDNFEIEVPEDKEKTYNVIIEKYLDGGYLKSRFITEPITEVADISLKGYSVSRSEIYQNETNDDELAPLISEKVKLIQYFNTSERTIKVDMEFFAHEDIAVVILDANGNEVKLDYGDFIIFFQNGENFIQINENIVLVPSLEIDGFNICVYMNRFPQYADSINEIQGFFFQHKRNTLVDATLKLQSQQSIRFSPGQVIPGRLLRILNYQNSFKNAVQGKYLIIATRQSSIIDINLKSYLVSS